jgi:hypothetical protein
MEREMTLALKGLSELFEVARDRVLLTLPNETYQSYPIVTIEPGARGSGLVVFLYGGLRSVPREGRYFSAPALRATFDATTGDLRSRESVSPAELGGPHAAGEIIGLHVLAQGLTTDAYTAKRERLFSLYDRLAARLVGGEQQTVNGGAAREFRELFISLTEKPLAPYYRAVGRTFFAWVDELAGPA